MERLKDKSLWNPLLSELYELLTETAHEIKNETNADSLMLMWEQLRSVFTTMCIVYGWNADTWYVDSLLMNLREKTGSEESSHFEDFMLAHIV